MVRLSKRDYAIIARNAGISLLGALLVSTLLLAVTGHTPANLDRATSGLGAYVFLVLSIIIFAPAVETMILGFLFQIFRQKLSDNLSGYMAALIFASAHSLVSPGWGLVVAIPAVIFTLPFREIGQGRLRDAMLRSGLTHALHNTIAFMAIIVAEYM